MAQMRPTTPADEALALASRASLLDPEVPLRPGPLSGQPLDMHADAILSICRVLVRVIWSDIMSLSLRVADLREHQSIDRLSSANQIPISGVVLPHRLGPSCSARRDPAQMMPRHQQTTQWMQPRW